MNKFFGLMLALVLGCAMPTHAQYSQNPDADYVQINAEGWLFCPATDSSEVKGFLALLDGAGSAGLNIQLVWYQAEADGSWTSWGWEEPDFGGAVWWVRSYLNDSLAFTHDIDLNEAAETVGPEAAVPPLPLVNGMFGDDPFQPVVEQAEDPVAVVDVLATAGWQIVPAMSSVEVGDANPCGPESANALQCLLDELASEVELAYFGSSNRNTGGEIGWPCKCTRTYVYGIWGPWGFSHGHHTGGGRTTCHYTRTRPATMTAKGRHRWCWPCDDVVPFVDTGKTSIDVDSGPCPPSP